MGAGRKKAATELRERLRGKAEREPDDLIDGVLVLMALLFDDVGETLDETLERDADEQLRRHIEGSAGVELAEAKAPPEHPHPDLDRIANADPLPRGS